MCLSHECAWCVFVRDNLLANQKSGGCKAAGYSSMEPFDVKNGKTFREMCVGVRGGGISVWLKLDFKVGIHDQDAVQ